MPDDPPRGFRKPLTLGDVLRAATQQQPRLMAKSWAHLKAIPEIEMLGVEMPRIEMLEMPRIEMPRIEIAPAALDLLVETEWRMTQLQQIIDRALTPAEAEPAPPEQGPRGPRHVFSDADQKVLDHLMQLPVRVKLADGKAAAKEMGYGRRRFERVWAHFPSDRKHLVGAPKGSKRKRIALSRRAKGG